MNIQEIIKREKKECEKCEGWFQGKETISEGQDGKLYCEACFKEVVGHQSTE
jgi:hypothetical protein